ncbi:hypothetical protein [Herbaspirillum sp. SJZ107]|uniref:hypothetical protein n=1 Tax=Herbaspirillum sp. SJZ107 TaxID=2572881 RepID=UPI001154320A|nr:hypothetical protein [Herbaspirillum sp. SJZ107]
MTEFDITTSAGREQALSHILPESAKQHHEMLRQLFVAEMEYRRRDDDHDYFENIYWCAYLLFKVGDPSDSEVMWRAKHINMDTGCGFDTENLVGAGVDETVTYLDKHGFRDIARYILSCTELRDRSHIESWTLDRHRYFYGA